MTLPGLPASPPQHKAKRKDEKVARGIELGAQGVAGTIGTAFGASKLRDAYRDDLKLKHGNAGGEVKFAQNVKHGERRATSVVGPARAAKLAHTATSGKPNFKHLVTAVAAGSVATGAARYQKAEKWLRDRKHLAPSEQSKRLAEVLKSQLPNGDYKPASQLSPQQRKSVRRVAPQRTEAAQRLREAAPAARGMDQVYAGHALAAASSGPKKLINAKTTQSGKHKNIQYGESIPASAHNDLDQRLANGHADRLRHPVVIHHDEMPDSVHAAAIGAHKQLTGGKGHVVMNAESLGAGGKPFDRDNLGGAKGNAILNHELVHADTMGKNPQRFATNPHRLQSRAAGEEARADAKSQPKKGIYERTGAIAPKKRAQAARGAYTPARLTDGLASAGVHPTPKEMKPIVRANRANVGSMLRYHHVKDAIKGATKLKKSYEGQRRAPGGNPLRIGSGLAPKHSAGYVGQRRAPGALDKLKVNAMVHGPKIVKLSETLAKSAPVPRHLAPGGNPLRVAKPIPGRHQAKSYAGARRKPSLGDKLKIQAMVHEPKLNRVVEEFTDIFKAERIDKRATLDSHITRGHLMSKSAFGVPGIEVSKADSQGRRRRTGAVGEMMPPKPTALDTSHRRDNSKPHVARLEDAGVGQQKLMTTKDRWSGRAGTARLGGKSKAAIATGAVLGTAGAAAGGTALARRHRQETSKSAFGVGEVSKVNPLAAMRGASGAHRAATTAYGSGERAGVAARKVVDGTKKAPGLARGGVLAAGDRVAGSRKVQVAVGGGAVGTAGVGAGAGIHRMTRSNDQDDLSNS